MTLRAGLPPLPDQMAGLPRHGGLPVPFFVYVGPDGRPDFRVLDARRQWEALEHGLCLTCGQPFGNGERYTFVVSPGAVLERADTEAPHHLECARWAVQVCPFLIDPKRERRAANMPAGVDAHTDPNPGLTFLYQTDQFLATPVAGGPPLLALGRAVHLSPWRAGRPATQAEVYSGVAYTVVDMVLHDARAADLVRPLAELAVHLGYRPSEMVKICRDALAEFAAMMKQGGNGAEPGPGSAEADGPAPLDTQEPGGAS